IDTKAIDSMPLNGRDFAQLATLVHVVKSTGTADLNICCQSTRNNVWSVDGVDNNEEVVGNRQSEFAQDAIREFQVLTNQFSAEFGRATGGVVNILTRSGTNDLHTGGFYFIRDDSLDAKPTFARSQAPFRRQQFGATAGGPIVRDRVHYFGSVERLAEDRVASVVSPALRADFPQPTRNILAFGKLTSQLTGKHTLQVSLNYTRLNRQGLNIGGIRLPSNGSDQKNQNHIFVAGLTSVFSGRSLNELRFSIQRRNPVTEPRDPVGPEIRRPSSIEGRANNLPARRLDTRYQIVENFTRVFDWRGEHSLKVGADIGLYRGYSYLGTFFGGVFTFTTDRPFDPNDLTTYPIEYTVRTGALDLTTPNNLLGFYVRDAWKPHANLTLNVGLRYDVEVGTVHGVFPVDRNNLAPRMAVAWTPFGDSRTVIRGGYGLFYDQLFLNLQQNLPRAGAPPPLGVGITQTFVVRNPGYPDPFSRPTGSPAIQDGAISDGHEESPYAFQTSVGLSRQLTSSMAVSADYVRSRGYHMVRNFDHNIVDPATGLRPRPQFGRLYSYETSGRTWYDALQTSFEKRLSHGYQFLVSYTLSKAVDNLWTPFTNIAGAAPQSYFDLDAEKGPSESDERHRLVASGVVQLPLGLQLGAVLTTYSGRPYNITTGRDNNRDGNLSDRPSWNPSASGNARYVDPGLGFTVTGNLPRNAGRGTPYAALDVRLSRFIQVGRTRVEVLAEAFNVTNRTNYSSYSGNLRSALFNKAIAAFANRQIQLGARIEF
ncbi:MAG: TonB-dependent receptor, partial [Acidobacteria bacterium]|nr:TonB-dependent receptor [Acidobacteriota bacterium]